MRHLADLRTRFSPIFGGGFSGAAEVIIEAPPDHDPLPHYHLIADHENVVAWGHSYLRPRGQAEAAPMPISYLFMFRDDLIVYFEDRFDTTYGGQLLGTLPRPQSTSPD